MILYSIIYRKTITVAMNKNTCTFAKYMHILYILNVSTNSIYKLATKILRNMTILQSYKENNRKEF